MKKELIKNDISLLSLAFGVIYRRRDSERMTSGGGDWRTLSHARINNFLLKRVLLLKIIIIMLVVRRPSREALHKRRVLNLEQFSTEL